MVDQFIIGKGKNINHSYISERKIPLFFMMISVFLPFKEHLSFKCNRFFMHFLKIRCRRRQNGSENSYTQIFREIGLLGLSNFIADSIGILLSVFLLLYTKSENCKHLRKNLFFRRGQLLI